MDASSVGNETCSLASTASHVSPTSSEAGVTPTALIVGGGVEGLMAAVALARAGADVHVYEQLSGPAASSEAALPLSDELRDFLAAHKVPLHASGVVSSSGRQVLSRDGDVCLQDSMQQEFVSCEALYTALLQSFPASHFHYSSKVVAVDASQPDIVVAQLESGERVAGHMLVAADGITSRVRRQLLPFCQPTYAGYLAWRGITHLERLSSEVQHLLGEKSTMYKGLNLHIQVHPLPRGGKHGSGTPLSWTWFNNQLEEELPGLLLDQGLRVYGHAVPLGRLNAAVADAVEAAALTALPAPLAELVSQSKGCMSVTSVSDMALPRQVVGRVAFVGKAGCVVRPHGVSAAHKAALDAQSLAEVLRSRKLSVDRALPAWEAQQVQQGVGMCRAAAAAGNRLQGL